jgi:large subunit ribosomal protein L32
LPYNGRLRADLKRRVFHQPWVLRTPQHIYDKERIMAVQQNKKSPSKRGMHRAHNALVVPGIAVEATTGETHLRHHISPTGFYRGRKVVKTKSEA